jgi:hypothetical protein
MQLMRRVVSIAAFGLLLAIAAPAHADGTLAMRGYYYKEKATRVVEPMLDATFEVGEEDEADAHALVDAVTSASVAAGALGAEPFSEQRYEIGGGYRHKRGNSILGGSARYSYEPDYASYFVGASFTQALAQENTTVGVAAAIGQDSVESIGAFGVEMHHGDLTTLVGSASLTQVVTANMIAGVTYDLAHLDGCQSNPYRSAITGDGLVPERNPELRTRHAIAGTLKRFLPSTETTLITTYRFYADTWDIEAHTPELRVIQEAGDGIDFAVRYRFHWQSAADFYMPSYPTNDPDDFPYVTDDVKLSRFTTHTIGFKVGVLGEVFGLEGNLEGARGELLVEYIDQNNRFGNAVTAHAALTLPFTY